ncbi:hypothetical protein ACFLX3_03815, partial [Chloroflexota bacterium]
MGTDIIVSGAPGLLCWTARISFIHSMVAISKFYSPSGYGCEMKVCIYSRVSTGQQDTTNQ